MVSGFRIVSDTPALALARRHRRLPMAILANGISTIFSLSGRPRTGFRLKSAGIMDFHVQKALGARIIGKTDLLPYLSFNLMDGEGTGNELPYDTILDWSPICTNCIDVNENVVHVLFSYRRLRWP